METVDLAAFRNPSFRRGAGRIKEALWILVSFLVFRLWPFCSSQIKCEFLRAFGAKVGVRVVIKPQVKITFPWKLEIGNNVWLGEECWLLNLDKIVIGDNVCISQRAFLCTGSHNFTLPTFDLIVKPIKVEDGSWLGAGCWVGPGVKIGTHAVLTAGSVASKDLEPWGVYRGNPASLVKRRTILGAAPDTGS